MISSLSSSSLKQYNVAIKKWWGYCRNNNIDLFKAPTPVLLKFLTEQSFHNSASYSTLNTYRSALAIIYGKQFSEDDLVTRFFRGIYRMKPCLPKYSATWDPNIVLDHLSNLYPNEELDLELITKKLVTLLALSTAQRVQTLSLIRIDNIKRNSSNLEIFIDDLIKTSAPGRLPPRLILPFFPNKYQICPAKTLLSYLDLTKTYRDKPKTERLILTFKKPIHNASSSTISRWIKNTLFNSGIDTTIFSAHSVRHASTSAANRKGISIDVIKRTAGWTGNSLVFSKFYNRPLLGVRDDNAFAGAIYNNN